MPIRLEAHRQAECLGRIAAHIKSWGEPPTLSEVATKMDCDKVSVHLLVKKLESQALLIRAGSGWRNLRLTAKGTEVNAGKLGDYFGVEQQQARARS